MNIELIHKKVEEYKELLKQETQQSGRYSLFRLFLIAVFVFSLYQGVNKASIWYIGMGLSLVLFLYVARCHEQLKSKIEDDHAMMSAYEDLISRKSGDWKKFADNGSQYLSESSTQEYDLDIFGKASLYQYLCVAKTPLGKDALARLLSVRKQPSDSIQLRQEAVQECIQNTSFTMRMTMLLKLFEQHGRKKRRKSLEDFFAYMEERDAYYPSVVKVLLYILPVPTITSGIATMFFHVSYAYLLVLSILSLCLAFLFFMSNSNKLSRVADSAELMKDYERMLREISAQNFQSVNLQAVHEQLKDASEGIRKLNRILSMVRLRGNAITMIIANAFVLLDFQCVQALGVWKQSYGNQVRTWLSALGEAEALLSLAQMGYAKEMTVVPEVMDRSLHMHMKEMKHPLLLEGEAVPNNFDAKQGSYIITGSNMSGKTTFLRTIGVNLVLMNAGAPVCAKEFSASSMNLYTSMRVMDDVSEGISTFYAEILRIKQMMEESAREEEMLVLIDEIFKGTNSADRILCAKQAIVRLHLPWVITMVSTHDFELCDLDKDPAIQAENYHFSEYYEGDRICFDYTLKDGRCTTTNATQLMKLAGF